MNTTQRRRGDVMNTIQQKGGQYPGESPPVIDAMKGLPLAGCTMSTSQSQILFV